MMKNKRRAQERATAIKGASRWSGPAGLQSRSKSSYWSPYSTVGWSIRQRTRPSESERCSRSSGPWATLTSSTGSKTAAPGLDGDSDRCKPPLSSRVVAAPVVALQHPILIIRCPLRRWDVRALLRPWCLVETMPFLVISSHFRTKNWSKIHHILALGKLVICIISRVSNFKLLIKSKTRDLSSLVFFF